MPVVLFLAAFVPATLCAAEGPLGLSADERWDLAVDADAAYRPLISEPTWVVPSRALPGDIVVQPANNNVALALHASSACSRWSRASGGSASARSECAGSQLSARPSVRRAVSSRQRP